MIGIMVIIVVIVIIVLVTIMAIIIVVILTVSEYMSMCFSASGNRRVEPLHSLRDLSWGNVANSKPTTLNWVYHLP